MIRQFPVTSSDQKLLKFLSRGVYAKVPGVCLEYFWIPFRSPTEHPVPEEIARIRLIFHYIISPGHSLTFRNQFC